MKKQHPARRLQSRRQPNVSTRKKSPIAPYDALIKVVRHRFKMFRKAFGRDPKPHEPLFFVDGFPRPVLAEKGEIKNQLSDAAVATGVDLGQLFRLLGLR